MNLTKSLREKGNSHSRNDRNLFSDPTSQGVCWRKKDGDGVPVLKPSSKKVETSTVSKPYFLTVYDHQCKISRTKILTSTKDSKLLDPNRKVNTGWGQSKDDFSCVGKTRRSTHTPRPGGMGRTREGRGPSIPVRFSVVWIWDLCKGR